MNTAISQEVVKRIAESQVNIPDRITVHPRLLPQLQRRAAMVEDGTIDWGMGETLAIGSLLMEGTPVRLAGQDSRRGTFGQRHAVLVDRETGDDYTPLLYLSDDQARYNVYDSLLSEYAAMGFEYGYSLARPEALVMWEAQFGDFVNGAQTVVDEFISSAEQKWGQTSGVTLLLPHGYEGQGPDHSSARLERFLQLCAQNNMTVADADAAVELLPPAALAGPQPAPQAAGRLHPEVDAASEGRGVEGGGVHHRRLPPGHRRRDGGPGGASARSSSAPARSTTTWRRSVRSAARRTRRSSASSGCTRCRAPSSRPRSPSTRTPRSTSGPRRSRRTRVPGRSSPST